ncbi:NmrA family NAD(P)-binding protein [Nocardia arthritidis]|uniref:NAD(P)H-binding protein n=1 Tax=Nocardia arthritidis TaxID=228602 RepID=A0A6G9YFK4_9NOCA|nr:NmrA family NAD(P)-binding protein [Nocardia arthritidis]QIS11763.1 NAD(P)H-binding protein [Nocardia arthritidis]
MSQPTVLIIGATGIIGSALVDRLIPDHRDRHLRLVVATRHPEAAAERWHNHGIEIRRLDLDDAESEGLTAIRSAFTSIDRVFLLTGYTVQMLAESKAAVDAAKAEGVTHLVHIGVSAARDTTIAHFAWHQLIEAYIERSGLGYTHLRPAAFMQNLARGIGEPGVLTHFIGAARTNWIDTDDIAEVAAIVLRDPAAYAGHAYDLAAESASMSEIVEQLTAVTRQQWRYRPAEPQTFYDNMVRAGADPVYMACVRNVFERTRNGSLTEPDDILGTIRTITGHPATSLRDYFEKNRTEFTVAR